MALAPNWPALFFAVTREMVADGAGKKNVPVVLITTPEFHKSQNRVEKQTAWASEQFKGWIGHTERLPEVLPIKDLLAVARVIFPEGDAKLWQEMAGYADMNKLTKLAGLDALAKRARWLAERQRRAQATPEDLRRAMRESVTPVAVDETRTVRRARAVMSQARRDTSAAVSRIGARLVNEASLIEA